MMKLMKLIKKILLLKENGKELREKVKKAEKK